MVQWRVLERERERKKMLLKNKGGGVNQGKSEKDFNQISEKKERKNEGK